MLNRLFRAMIVPMFVFTVALPVAAQEVTPEPPAPAPVVTPETGINLITLLSGIAIGALAVGGSVFLLIGRIRDDKAVLTALEKLAESWPPETKELLDKIGGALNDLSFIIDEVTDDTPATDKPNT